MPIKSQINYNAVVRPNTELLETLKTVIPQYFDTEGNFKADKFAEELHASNVKEAKDGYRLSFVGKDYARLQTGLRPETMIVPCGEWTVSCGQKTETNVISLPAAHSCTENIFITGDNLEALRHLQNAYAGKVKMIYIDPPYNTGKEFVYNDKFEFDDKKLRAALAYNDAEIDRLKSIQGKSSHSAWLAFMYPRLKIAQKLLTDDGVIFVSIDDNEQANLKLLMDDVFGEGNFVGQIVIETANGVFGTRATGLTTTLVKVKDYVIVYAKSNSEKHFQPLYMPTNDRFDNHYSIMLDENLNRSSFIDYINQSHKIKNFFIKYSLRVSLENISKIMQIDNNFNDMIIKDMSDKIFQDVDFSLKVPEEIEKEMQKGKIVRYKDYIIFRTNNGTGKIRQLISFKQSLRITDEYNPEYRRAVAIGDLWEGFDNDMKNVSNEGDVPFDSPKPIRLIKQLAKWSNLKENDIVLDFFAGSGTTAHAVMQLNAEDGSNRKFILVQLDEPTHPDSEARKAGYNTIDEISRERIKRAAESLWRKLQSPENTMFSSQEIAGQANNDGEQNNDSSLDLGFRHYCLKPIETRTLDKITEFDPNEDKLIEDDMISALGGFETILTTWLIDDGYDFQIKVKHEDLKGYCAPYIEETGTIYLIETGFGVEQLKALLNRIGKGELTVSTIVIFPYSFTFEQKLELKNNVKNTLNNKINIIERY